MKIGTNNQPSTLIQFVKMNRRNKCELGLAFKRETKTETKTF